MSGYTGELKAIKLKNIDTLFEKLSLLMILYEILKIIFFFSHLCCNPSSMSGGVAVHGSDQDLDLTLHSGSFLLVSADDGEGSDSLAIETHVLGKTLSQENIVAIVDKLSEGEGISVNISRSKSLIRHVKIWEEVLRLDQGGHFLPLLGCGINSSWIVGTGVEQDHGSFRNVLDVLHGSSKV